MGYAAHQFSETMKLVQNTMLNAAQTIPPRAYCDDSMLLQGQSGSTRRAVEERHFAGTVRFALDEETTIFPALRSAASSLNLLLGRYEINAIK